jgi:hypothetical protein
VKSSPRFRITAIGVIATLFAGVLLAVAAPSVANASTSSSVSSIVSKFNAYRHSHGDLAALSRNAFIDLNAEEYAKQYASDPTGNLDTFTAPTALPVDGIGNGPGSTSDFSASVSGSSTSSLTSALLSIGGANVLGGYNYVGVGYATKGSHEYSYVVLLHYNGTPLKRITPGTVTIPKTIHVGDTVKLKTSGWSSGVSLTYEWVYNETHVYSTDPTYTIVYGEYGGLLAARVTAHKAGYAVSVVTSKESGPIKLGIPTAPKTLTVTGKRNVGQTLSAPAEGTDGWGPAAADVYTYEWFSNGKAIVGATHNTYVPQPADYGKRIDLLMALSGPEFSATVRQTHTKSLIGHPFLNQVTTLAISGGDEAWGTARTAGWDVFIEGVHYTFEWLVNGHKVSTHVTYTPSASDAGKQLVFKTTGTLSGNAPTTATSAPVNILKKTFANAPVVSITGGTGPSGAAEVGDHLIGHMSAPSNPTATSYTYQWYLDGVAVSGATGKTFTFKPKTAVLDVDLYVTAHRAGYTASAGTANISFN